LYRLQSLRISPVQQQANLVIVLQNVAMDHQNYLEEELSGEEDPGLTQNVTYMNAPDVNYKIPPGIRTLAQWGQQTFPTGKKAGKTFAQVFDEDDGYLMQVKNRKAVSPWMRSFQNYLQARWKRRAQQQMPVGPRKQNLESNRVTPKAMPSPNKTSGGYHIEETEWEKLSTQPSASSHKRGLPEKEIESKSPMKTEPNQAKIEHLQMQIAVLQRELALETRVPEDQ
jgi:hypothetical protein